MHRQDFLVVQSLTLHFYHSGQVLIPVEELSNNISTVAQSNKKKYEHARDISQKFCRGPSAPVITGQEHEAEKQICKPCKTVAPIKHTVPLSSLKSLLYTYGEEIRP